MAALVILGIGVFSSPFRGSRHLASVNGTAGEPNCTKGPGCSVCHVSEVRSLCCNDFIGNQPGDCNACIESVRDTLGNSLVDETQCIDMSYDAPVNHGPLQLNFSAANHHVCKSKSGDIVNRIDCC